MHQLSADFCQGDGKITMSLSKSPQKTMFFNEAVHQKFAMTKQHATLNHSLEPKQMESCSK